MSTTDRLRGLLERIEGEADRRLPAEDRFSGRLRSTPLTARVGRWLAVTFGICFATGLISHFVQHPWTGPGLWPTGPRWLYRVTQGLHVSSGVASVPLLAVKLWSVAPKFWRRPLFGGWLDGLERVSILILIAATSFELITGLLNVAEFYAWSFFFPQVHFAVAFVAVGSIMVHVAVKLPVIRRALGSPVEPVGERASGLTRRGVLGLAAAGAGLGVITTVGDKVSVLSRVSVFAQRTGRGSQGLPVNQTAAATGVTPMAADPAGCSRWSERSARCGSTARPWPRCRSVRPGCRSPASKAGRWRRSGRACRYATCSRWSESRPPRCG